MRTNNQLSYEPYQDALEGVETQFALIRFALKNLQETKLQNFFKNRAAESLAQLEKGFEMALSMVPQDKVEIVKSVFERSRESAAKEARKKSRKKDARFKLEMSEDRINQSELLLLVGHFESFLKKIHRQFLEVAAGKVFSKSDIKVMLSEVFEPTCGKQISSKFQDELFRKEVKKLDAQNIGVKADYFEKNFCISFGNEQEIAELSEIMELRNKISHQLYSEPPTTLEDVRDPFLVSDEKLIKARWFFLQIPRKCIEVGEKNYRGYFKLY